MALRHPTAESVLAEQTFLNALSSIMVGLRPTTTGRLPVTPVGLSGVSNMACHVERQVGRYDDVSVCPNIDPFICRSPNPGMSVHRVG